MSNTLPTTLTLSLASFKSTPVVKKEKPQEKKYIIAVCPEVFRANCEKADTAIASGDAIAAFAAMEQNGFRPQSLGEKAVRLALSQGNEMAPTVRKYVDDFIAYLKLGLNDRSLTGRSKHFIELLNVSAVAGKEDFEKVKAFIEASASSFSVEVPEMVGKAIRALSYRFKEPVVKHVQKDWKVLRAEHIKEAEDSLNKGFHSLAAEKLKQAAFGPHALCERLISEDPNRGQMDSVGAHFMVKFSDFITNGLTTQEVADKRSRHLCSFLELKAAQNLAGYFLELHKLQELARANSFTLPQDVVRLTGKVERIMCENFHDLDTWTQLGFQVASRSGQECAVVHETTGYTMQALIDEVEQPAEVVPPASAPKKVRERRSRARTVEVAAE